MKVIDILTLLDENKGCTIVSWETGRELARGKDSTEYNDYNVTSVTITPNSCLMLIKESERIYCELMDILTRVIDIRRSVNWGENGDSLTDQLALVEDDIRGAIALT